MKPLLIAGPCAAESEQQLLETARQLHEIVFVHNWELAFFRAGVWKPRSNPDSFAGMGEKALPWLARVQRECGFAVCTEVMTPEQVALCERYDIHTLWIGARTGVDPIAVQQLADAVKGKPFTILVKNPMVPDVKLWAGNVERFLKANVKQVMAVHRGFADSNENVYRNAPCWNIPIDLKVQYPDLPILCDPSHLCGHTRWIPQIAQLALVYGFDGLMLECHPQPDQALSDADQQVTPRQWEEIIESLVFKNNVPNRELIKQRALLENVDTQLSELLARRFQIVDEIARIKKENNLPVVQPQQWQQVCKRYLKPGQDIQYQEFIEEFLQILHLHSIKKQQS
ncbi:MAG: chorismate mutase [Bacteroidales bacterium]|nr:chorismate mutase [Bacteroidales bacterium]MCR5551248.1 chorismate mutase [Bacteroidales bacterium]